MVFPYENRNETTFTVLAFGQLFIVDPLVFRAQERSDFTCLVHSIINIYQRLFVSPSSPVLLIKTHRKPKISFYMLFDYNSFIFTSLRVTSMQIEDQHPSTLSIAELLKDEQNKIKVVRILHQALSSMGFTESALELQKESSIFPEEEAQFKVKALLDNNQYQKISEVVQEMHISAGKKSEILQILKELVVLKFIQGKEFQSAIEMVMSNWPEDEQKQLSFFSIIATNQLILCEQFQARAAQVLQKCTSESCELKTSIERMLKGYLKSTQQEHRSLNTEQPFKKTIAESQKLSKTGKTSFVKFNPKGNLICLVSQTRNEMEASIWMIGTNKITMGLNWKQENFGVVSNVCWDLKGQKIAICSQTKLGIFDVVSFKPKIILDSRNLTNNRLLCCRWNSQDFLFLGGLTDAIAALDGEGKIVRTIRPFVKVREIVFNSLDELYSICATRGLVSRYNVKEEKVISTFESEHLFMDLYLNEIAHTVVVTNKEHIYLLNSITLEPITTLISPNNEKMFKIEAFFVNDWLIVFNEKLTAILQNNLVTRHHLWPDCDAVDIRGNQMVTVKSTIMVWQSDSAILNAGNNLKEKSDNLEEAQWQSLDLEQELVLHEEMHSLSDEQSPAPSESEEESEDLEHQNQINIEYLQNQHDSESDEQP